VDAYGRVWSLQRRRARAAEPGAVRVAKAVGGVAVVAALVPLVRSALLGFLDVPGADVVGGLGGAWTRASLLVLVTASLAVHGNVLRGPARAVLQIHPVDPRSVVREELAAAARGQAVLVLAVIAVLAPVALEVGWLAWVLGALVVAGVAASGLVLGAVVLLGAIEAAESPAWAPWLDLVRGNNPRPQAAIIWALAPSTLVAGWVAVAASEAAARAATGPTAAAAWIAGPWALAALGSPFVPRLAERTWFRASVVLADIAARYAALEPHGAAREVALDWTVRWLPAEAARWALLELRYGWRERRTWLSAVWLVTIGAVVLGWTGTAAAAPRAGLVAGAAGWLVGVLPVLRAREEAPFLRHWLPGSTGALAAARAWAVLAWGSGAVLATAVVVLLVHGSAALGAALATAVPSLVVAALASSGWATLRERGMAPYVGSAALALASVAALGGVS
jgi:hypothetical protein